MTHTVHEEAAPFQHGTGPSLAGTPFEGLGRFRTFGSAGPMYEVLAVRGQTVRIFLYNSDEEADYGLDRALTDPVAE